MQKKIKIIIWLLGTILFLYLLVAGSFYLFQGNIVFQPESLPENYAYTFEQKFEEHFIPTQDGYQLNALLFKADTSKGLILYFHGNAGNLQRWGQLSVDFTSLGYDILMMDYRGYGKSTGTPNEENLYKDAQVMLEWSQKKMEHKRLVIYGRSLGAAVATNLAMQSNPDLLILETPFDELASLLYTLPSRYNFRNNSMLPAVKCRKIIIHGTEDGVVPLSSSLRLKQLLKETDQFVIIEGGGHNDLREFEEYQKTLKKVLN